MGQLNVNPEHASTSNQAPPSATGTEDPWEKRLREKRENGYGGPNVQSAPTPDPTAPVKPAGPPNNPDLELAPGLQMRAPCYYYPLPKPRGIKDSMDLVVKALEQRLNEQDIEEIFWQILNNKKFHDLIMSTAKFLMTEGNHPWGVSYLGGLLGYCENYCVPFVFYSDDGQGVSDVLDEQFMARPDVDDPHRKLYSDLVSIHRILIHGADSIASKELDPGEKELHTLLLNAPVPNNVQQTHKKKIRKALENTNPSGPGELGQSINRPSWYHLLNPTLKSSGPQVKGFPLKQKVPRCPPPDVNYRCRPEVATQQYDLGDKKQLIVRVTARESTAAEDESYIYLGKKDKQFWGLLEEYERASVTHQKIQNFAFTRILRGFCLAYDLLHWAPKYLHQEFRELLNKKNKPLYETNKCPKGIADAQVVVEVAAEVSKQIANNHSISRQEAKQVRPFCEGRYLVWRDDMVFGEGSILPVVPAAAAAQRGRGGAARGRGRGSQGRGRGEAGRGRGRGGRGRGGQ